LSGAPAVDATGLACPARSNGIPLAFSEIGLQIASDDFSWRLARDARALVLAEGR
jgi:hypothetical protein